MEDGDMVVHHRKGGVDESETLLDEEGKSPKSSSPVNTKVSKSPKAVAAIKDDIVEMSPDAKPAAKPCLDKTVYVHPLMVLVQIIFSGGLIFRASWNQTGLASYLCINSPLLVLSS